ncbi:MAG TPA: hypothetical protein VN408_38540 [Actinoplanes sp.]|nr:hypothetical protein [Actinoplanes sp.]
MTDLSDVARVFPEYPAITAGTLITLSRLPVVGHQIVNTETGSDLALPPPPFELKVDVRVGDFNTSPAMGDNRGLLDVTEDAAGSRCCGATTGT